MKQITLNTKSICRAKNLRQVDFIRYMDAHGISRNTAIKVYHGDGNINLNVAVAAASVLGCGLDKIVKVDGNLIAIGEGRGAKSRAVV